MGPGKAPWRRGKLRERGKVARRFPSSKKRTAGSWSKGGKRPQKDKGKNDDA